MSLKLLTIVLVSLGIMFLSISSYWSIRLIKIIPEKLHLKWNIISFLIFVFIAGYSSFLFVQLHEIEFPLEFLTGCIFLGGAFFVFLVVNLSKTTISNIFESENKLVELNRNLQRARDQLELRVEERTGELSKANERLTKEIRERRQAEKETRLAHAELDQIFQTAADGMRVIDKNFSMVRVNETFLAMAGIDKNGWKGKKCYEVFSGTSCHSPDCPLTRSVNGEKFLEAEVEKKCQDGASMFCIVVAAPYRDQDGNLLGIIEDFKDITGRKNAERSLEQSLEESQRLAEELKAKNQEIESAHEKLKAAQAQMLQREKMASVGQLAAGVAHEINNPVGFIASNLGTLSKYVDRLTEYNAVLKNSIKDESGKKLEELSKKLKIDFIAEDAKELIKESLNGTDRVSKIVQNLKSFSRIDESESKPADINECLESTLNMVWNELKYKTTVHKDYGDLPLTRCNPQQLNQVFMNLLINASHAIEQQGEIRIKTWQRDNSVFVAISDTGCGIPEKNLNRLFEPFFTTKEVGKGTGLGLSIAYDIIKKHGGRISVDSEVGKGANFTVQLPIAVG